ncbi:hypothetical protein ACMFMG_011699 [Clarireedia jacksonii]
MGLCPLPGAHRLSFAQSAPSVLRPKNFGNTLRKGITTKSQYTRASSSSFEELSKVNQQQKGQPAKDESFLRKHTQIDGAAEAERPVSLSKRLLKSSQSTRSLSGLQALNLREKNEDIVIDDSPEDTTADQPRKRAAVGDGISAGSASREASGSPPPRKSKAQPPRSPMDADSRRQTTTSQRPKGQLWAPDQASPFKDHHSICRTSHLFKQIKTGLGR